MVQQILKTYFLLLVGCLASCDPIYTVAVQNDSSRSVYLRTAPAIESLYDKRGTYYDSIVGLKIRQEDAFSVYEIKPCKKFIFHSGLGNNPATTRFPFKDLQVIKGHDTLNLKNSGDLMKHLQGSKRKRDFSIVIN